MSEVLTSLTGHALTDTQFRIHHTETYVDIDRVIDVLEGRLAAYRISNYLPAELCQQIVRNFWLSPKRSPRYGDGEDGVEGYLIGASHIEKTTDEYLLEATETADSVKALYQGAINPIAVFRESLVGKDQKYTRTRAAEFKQYKAGDSKAVYWNSLGEFLLQPHDDLAQLSDPRQAGFEIQKFHRVMAINFYAEVPSDAGQLKVWNIEPDDKSRAELNLTHSGFPYPPEVLEDIPSAIIPVATGDLCVLNGNLVHAVIRGNPTSASKNRLLITCFMSFNDQGELIWWT